MEKSVKFSIYSHPQILNSHFYISLRPMAFFFIKKIVFICALLLLSDCLQQNTLFAYGKTNSSLICAFVYTCNGIAFHCSQMHHHLTKSYWLVMLQPCCRFHSLCLPSETLESSRLEAAAHQGTFPNEGD